MRILTLAICAAATLAAGGQTALDAYQLSQGDLKGTARFVSMGGAFTALGGDLSTMQQNPAGLGVYRSSDIGITMNIDIQSVKANGTSTDQTKVTVPTAGYIGAFRTGSQTMPYFAFGVSYGRVASFNRKYSGAVGGVNSSLSNYVAGYTASEAWTTAELNGYDADYDPFYGSKAPWMSILMYNAYAINPSGLDQTDYEGLFNGKDPGRMTFDTVEKGYVDEYNIDFGGNILNTVYWGIGFGITDIDYQNNTYYTETFDRATISTPNADGRTSGAGQFGILSRKKMSGTGINFKAGVIVKPINELRFGLAVHTPTYYNLDYTADAQTNFRYVYGGQSQNLEGYYPTQSTYGADDYFRWKLRTPWRLMVGMAGVIGNKAIVSVDYEYRAYKDMKVKDDDGTQYNNETADVKTFYTGQSIIRIGAEYRITPRFSARAGFVWEQAPTSEAFRNGDYMVYTAGPDNTETQSSFIMDKGTRYITLGLGYNFSNFYISAAYVNKHRESIWQGYTNYEGGTDATRYYAPRAKLTDNNSQLVFSVGYRF